MEKINFESTQSICGRRWEDTTEGQEDPHGRIQGGQVSEKRE